MANFTQNRIIQYKDYTPVSPVDLMTQVGVQREAEQQQGIQKVNNYFESIGGLDVARDSDKQYIQQSLNSLKEGITKNLSGDFSDARITNQIGGAASQIYKDPIVQNAVVSTATIRKGQSDLDEYRKSGKYSASQEYVFNYDVNNYLTNKDPKASFNSRAKQYTDYKKKMVDGLKALTGDESITDSAFTTDADGKTVLADATIRTKLAGFSPEKIQRYMMATLTSEDFDQMAADGRYAYANKSPEQFASELQNSYKQKRDDAQGYIDRLKIAASSVSDTTEKNKLEQEIAGEQERIKGMEAEYNSIILSGDVEQAKAQKGTFDFINGFSNAFAYKNVSTTYEGKTPQEMMMWREDKSQDWKKFSLKFQQDAEQFGLTYAQKEREIALKKKEVEGYGGIKLPKSQDELAPMSSALLVEQIKQQEIPLELARKTVIKQSSQAGLIPEGVDEDKWLNAQRVNWLANPNKVSPKVAAYFNNNYNKERVVEANKQLLIDLDKQADKAVGSTEQLIPKLKPVTLTFHNKDEYGGYSESFTYSPKDFVETIPKFQNYITVDPTTNKVSVDYEAAKASLSPKEYKLFEEHEKGNSVVNQYVKNYSEAVLQPKGGLIAKRTQFIDNELQKRTTSIQSTLNTIPITTPAQQKSMAGVLSQLSSFATESGGKVANSPNFDPEVAIQLAGNSDTQYHLVVDEGTSTTPGTYKVIANGTVKGKAISTEVALTPEQKRDVFGTAFESDPKTLEFNQTFGEQIRKAGGASTGMAGKTYLVTKDFPQVNNYGITGNVVVADEGKYYYKLGVLDPLTNVWKSIQWPKSGATSAAGAIDAKNSLSDDIIFQLLNNGKVATPEEKKLLQQASQAPTF